MEHEGRVLICQRRAGDRHPLKWEFPGGKVEPGETPRAALERELREELAVAASIGPEVARYQYTYTGRAPVLLIFHRVSQWQGEPRNLAFTEIRWEAIERLPEYDFLEGDVELVRRLARGQC